MAATRVSSTNGETVIGTGSVSLTTQLPLRHIRTSPFLFIFTASGSYSFRYAPAYERYGSQIKAIHFIGPDKPWNSLVSRTPFSGHQPDSPDSSSVQRAYDYDSLVDRWFDIYDRHYRTQSILPQTPFEVQRYTAAWDQPTENNLQPPPVDALGLDELKRLAIQGMSASNTDTRPGEGTYQTMPLEGRVDLMRLRKEIEDEKTTQANPKAPQPQLYIPQSFDDSDDHYPADSFNFEEALSTPIARHATLGDNQPRWETLPTPGPNEVPPSPRLRLVSLPPTPSALPPFPKTPADFYESESEAENLLLSKPDNVHHHHTTPLAPEPQQEPLQHHHHPNDQEVSKTTPARPISPPMVSWNPAVEPPPNVTPTPNAFPADTYFANVWDHAPSRQNDQPHPGPSPSDSGGFFQPPPPSIIPDTLIKQGHYRNVTGESLLGATPSPDRTKIKTVFPWEVKPRVMPGRVFPDSDAPPPSLFLSPGGQSQTSTATPSTPETKVPSYPARAMPLSPLYGLPTTLNYANAWDTIPSIQKYASKLVKAPPPPPATLAPAFEDDTYRKGRRMSRDERAEMSSHDGDDEDNADDDEHLASSGNEWDDDSDGEFTRRRSRRGSVVTATALKSRKKEYKNCGVQTLTIEKRTQAVQVDPPPKPEYKHSKRGSISSKRHWAPATGASIVAPTTTKEVTHGGHDLSPPPLSPLRTQREFIALTSSGGTKTAAKAPPLKPTVRTSDSLTSIPMPSGNAVVPSPVIVSASHSAPPPTSTKSPKISTASMVRRSSNDSSLGSPASSFGPVSPAEGHLISSPLRKATRVWDPARGVDLFKRGSEEVLARFLKMGAWEEEIR